MKVEFIFIQAHSSTNEYAIEFMSKSNPNHVYCIYTYNQTDGKGQIGRKWDSQPNMNLSFSLVIPFDQFHVDRQIVFNKQIALAIKNALLPYFEQQVKIKWPNDIYINDKKIAGILIQNVLQGKHIKYAVVGIGINVLQKHFNVSIPNPTSFALEGIELNKTLTELLHEIVYKIIKTDFNPSRKTAILIGEKYNSDLYKLGLSQDFEFKEERINRTIKEVNEKGQLVLIDDQIEETYNFGQLKFINK